MTTIASEETARRTLALLGSCTTMIGSLPHHNIDAALEFAFKADIPFLPQIPIRNPWEYMIAQALEGMPGLLVEKDGAVTLDTEVWTGRAHALDERLLHAFSAMVALPDAFESFEPSAATSSSWQPFLWELEERGHKIAKIQIAGPLTAQWALQFSDGTNINRHPDVASQIYRLVLARALGMSRRLQRGGIQPILYIDEPGLSAFSVSDPRHIVALKELRLLVHALRKEGIIVGVHCCSDGDWASILSLGTNILSIDADLSLEGLLKHARSFDAFLGGGGKLSLGIVPTARPDEPASQQAGRAQQLRLKLIETFARSWGGESQGARHAAAIEQVIAGALYTPACGLALHTTSNAEAVLATLLDFGALCKKARA